jgi:HK97 family phage prohead protease
MKMKYSDYCYKAGLAVAKEAKDTLTLAKFLNENNYLAPSFVEKSLPEGLAALGEREALFVLTDSGVDREGDVIVSAGVDVEQWKQFGSILWGHRADEPDMVLGRPAEVIKEDTRIVVRTGFFDAETNPTADRVLRMVKAGGVSAMSIGILIMEFTEATDRGGFMPLNILRSEAMEGSITPIPANPRAVRLAAGSSDEEAKAIQELFEEATETPEQLEATVAATGLDEETVKSLVLETVKELNGHKVISTSTPAPRNPPTVLDILARSIRA